jgi:hypothetical protein
VLCMQDCAIVHRFEYLEQQLRRLPMYNTEKP